MKALAAALFIASSLCAGSACASLPNFASVKAAHQPSDSLLLDRQGEPIHRLRTDNAVRRGQWLALTEVSPALRTALVLSEDKRFYEHSGVDWRAVSAAAWANLWNRKTRGASTLTMQLAGLLDDDLRHRPGGRSLWQKIGQTAAASELEANWRKDQILEAYLNLVPLKGELVGIDALSQTLFGKAAHALDNREAATTAALVRAPNAAVDKVALRACGVLKNMEPVPNGCGALNAFVAAALDRKAFAPSEGLAPHLAQRLKPNHGQPLRTSVSAPLQRFAMETLQTQLRELKGRNAQDAALVVLDNASGEVLAWVGSSGGLSQAGEVDGVTALRQPGSALKPFLYAQAIAEQRITAASLLDDSSAQLHTASGLYIPQNYDHRYKGWVSARTALGASLNVPAVRTLVMVTPDAFARQLKRLGMALPQTGDFYGDSLALGSAEVSLLALSNAYRALANGGRLSSVRFTPSEGPAEAPLFEPVLDARAAFIVSDILADPLARARTFGTDSVLSTRFWSAVKTGTSKDMRDNWAVGYSERYTVGVWVGNASGQAMWDVSGTSGAAPIWAALMNHLHANTPSRAPTPPAGVVSQRVQFSDAQNNALEATRNEWFIGGTQQARFALDTSARSGQGKPRITSPTDGTIVALDPDIPPAAQRLRLSADGTALRWRVDGRAIGQGNAAYWPPWPGRHRIELTDARGRVLDVVQVEVRGAGVVTSSNGQKSP